MEVLVTDEFVTWYHELDERDAQAVYHYVGLLEAKGVTLGFPYSSSIRGSEFALRELRVRSGRKALRVFYTFDSERNAVLLLGGVKTGARSFYEEHVTRAERIWRTYLSQIK